MNKTRGAYVVITTTKVHVFGTESTARRVYARALKMGVKEVEYVATTTRMGDRYKSAPDLPSWRSMLNCDACSVLQ